MKIRANLNIVGRPEKLVLEILQSLAEKIENNFKVSKKKILNPEPMSKNLFSGFLEVELELKGFQETVEFMLDYVPVTIEILENKDVTTPLGEFQSGMTDLITRIQEYEEGIKGLRAANTLFKKQLESISKHKNSKNNN